MDAPLALHGGEVLDDPVAVELAVVDAGEERVALQVVHPVGVQLSRHHLPQDGQKVAPAAAEGMRARRRAAADERRHVLGLDAARAEALADLRRQARVEHQLERVILVAGAAIGRTVAHPFRHAQLGHFGHHLLGGVRERCVSQVVEEHRQAKRLAEAVAVGRLQIELPGERGEHLGGDVHGAEAVRVARVRRAGERQVGEAELLHVAQPLVLRAIHQRPLVGGDLDGAVDGVADVHRDATLYPGR